MTNGGLLLAGLALALAGCGDAVTSQLSRKLGPSAAAAGAIKEYDKNGDGKISSAELNEAPSLAAGVGRLDGNGDGVLTKDEIQGRLEVLSQGADLIGVTASVFDPRGPLSGASVTLTPDPFQGEGMQSYSGVSGQGGECDFKGSEEQLPGLPSGFYVAHIVHQPSGVDETLGCEIASDASGNRLELRVGKTTSR